MTKKIIKKIKEYDNIALFHHINPDGDSLSSSYGLMLALKQAFPKKNIVWCANREAVAIQFKDWGVDDSHIVDTIDESYLTIMGDASILERIDKNEEFIKGKEKIVFDHHKNETNIDATIFWHEPTWPASTIQAIMIADELKVKFNEDIAYFLMIGLLTDTGNFTYSLGNPQPVEQYAKMLHYISNERMDAFHKMMKSRTKRDIEIQAYIYKNLQFNGRVAYCSIKNSIVKKFGAREIKFKVNSIGNIENYPIWALFTETKERPGRPWEISLRSNGPDVQKIAIKFKGGGHIRASGASIESFDKIPEVIKELNKK